MSNLAFIFAYNEMLTLLFLAVEIANYLRVNIISNWV